ncbi:g2361 [Coccomyxa viridis]|uniref:G2361 protein n=1 Tax=Coccomyxa viridis TaxID=1274662 RepID=A0ABP1FLU0_9CHLO
MERSAVRADAHAGSHHRAIALPFVARNPLLHPSLGPFTRPFVDLKSFQSSKQRQICIASSSTFSQSYQPDDPTPADGEVVPLRSSVQQSGPYGDFQAFVAGATGGTGQAIVRRLVAEGVPVRALVRDISRAASLLPPSVELVKGDVYQFSTLERALADSNVMFIATGSRPALDPFGPFNVDYQGVANLVEVGKRAKVKQIVLVSSIGADEPFFPLNLLWGVLFWKKRGEEALQRSGLPYTIVRPGGLLDAPRQGQVPGAIVLEGPGAFGLPPKRTPGSILRSQVADICVEALLADSAKNKVVEAIAEQGQPARSIRTLFASVY